MYSYNIVQQMRCGEISWKIQHKEQILGTLETTYLVEISKVELVSVGHGKKKYTQKWNNVPFFYIKNTS